MGFNIKINVTGAKVAKAEIVDVKSGFYMGKVTRVELNPKKDNPGEKNLFLIVEHTDREYAGIEHKVWMTQDFVNRLDDKGKIKFPIRHWMNFLVGLGLDSAMLDTQEFELKEEMFIGKEVPFHVEAYPPGTKDERGMPKYADVLFVGPKEYAEATRRANAQANAAQANGGTTTAIPATGVLSALSGLNSVSMK